MLTQKIKRLNAFYKKRKHKKRFTSTPLVMANVLFCVLDNVIFRSESFGSQRINKLDE